MAQGLSHRASASALALFACVTVVLACKKHDANVRPLDEKEKLVTKTSDPKPEDMPEPERVCARMEALGKQGPTSTDSLAGGRAKCIAEMRQMKENDPVTFRCIAECANVSQTADAAGPCVVGCVTNSELFKDLMNPGKIIDAGRD